MLTLIEEVYSSGGAGAAVDIKLLETSTRAFIRSAGDFETEEAHPDPRRTEYFANLEIEALGLIKTLKKVPEAKELMKSESKSPVDDLKDAEKVTKAKKCRKRVKVCFVNPRKNLKKTKFSCPHCDKIYESIKAVQNHARKDHKELKKVSAHDYIEEEPEIQCQLLKKNGNPCTFKAAINQMGRHCESHKIHKKSHQRPSPNTKFRGWRFFPEETKVVWLQLNEPDPPSSDEMEVSDDEMEDVPDPEEELVTNKTDNKAEDVHEVVVELQSPTQGQGISKSISEINNNSDTESTSKNFNNSTVDNVDANVPVPAINVDQTVDNLVSLEDDLIVPHIGPDVVEHFVVQPDDTLKSLSDTNTIAVNNSIIKVGDEFSLLVNNDDNRFVQTQAQHNICFYTNPDDISEVITIPKVAQETFSNEGYNENVSVSARVSDVLLSSSSGCNDETMRTSTNMEGDRLELNDTEKKEESNVDGNNHVSPDAFVVDKEDRIIIDSSTIAMLESQEIELVAENKDRTSQESITREQLSQPSSLNEVKDRFSNYVTVSVVNPIMKKGTVWTNPNADIYHEEKKLSMEDLTESNASTDTLTKSKPADDERNDLNMIAEEEDTIQQNVEQEYSAKDDLVDLDVDSDSEIEIDSDYDENYDIDIETTRIRQERKKVRHQNRDKAEQVELADHPNNASFISQFLDWLKSITSMSTTNEHCSTINLSASHGWEYHDSFLNFQCSEDPSFNLSRLIDFEDKTNFVFIPSPVDWILKARGSGKGNPSRSAEQLKLHKRLRRFIAFKALKHKFDATDVTFKMAITQHLSSIESEIADQKLFTKLSKQYKIEQAKSKKMKLILNPDADQLEYESVKVWFRSDECKSLLKEVDEIYEEAMKTGKIKPGKFNRCAMIIRFTIAIKDKNRPSIYAFTNLDYLSKKKAWLPDLDTYIWRIDDLPEGWKIYTPPSPGVPPTCFEIRLDGSNPLTKGNAETNVIIDRHSYLLAEKYQKLKKLVFDKLPSSSPYFVNHRGKSLSRLQKYPGSLVELFGKVIGKPDFNMTNIRKALEGKLQNSSDHGRNTQDINNHSSKYVKVYDNIAATRRNLVISGLGQAEGSTASANEEFKSFYDESEEGGEETMKQLKTDAKKFFEDKKKGKVVVDLTPSSLTQEDIMFLKSIFTDNDIKGRTNFNLVFISYFQ